MFSGFDFCFPLSTFCFCLMLCPESGYRYHELAEGKLQCLDLKENTSLPDELAKGTKGYDEFKPSS
jgi:hypothetical protein